MQEKQDTLKISWKNLLDARRSFCSALYFFEEVNITVNIEPDRFSVIEKIDFIEVDKF